MMMEHLDDEIRQTITRLADLLCQWERSTGRESVFILREQGGFCFRAANGKPNIPDDITDDQIIKTILG